MNAYYLKHIQCFQITIHALKPKPSAYWEDSQDDLWYLFGLSCKIHIPGALKAESWLTLTLTPSLWRHQRHPPKLYSSSQMGDWCLPNFLTIHQNDRESTWRRACLSTTSLNQFPHLTTPPPYYKIQRKHIVKHISDMCYRGNKEKGGSAYKLGPLFFQLLHFLMNIICSVCPALLKKPTPIKLMHKKISFMLWFAKK